MKVLCFGSVNIDYTYRVKHFVGKGETLAADSLQVFSGGKGLNQSVALARAGADTWHGGAVGTDGLFLVRQLKEAGVRTEHIQVLDTVRTGNAIIQNDAEGDNCIILYGGANRAVTEEQIAGVLEHFQEGDYLVLQNEISGVDTLIKRGRQKGMRIVLNPSPVDEALLGCPLDSVDYLILNQVEALQLLGQPAGEVMDAETVYRRLEERFPAASIVLTLGGDGALYRDGETVRSQPAYPVKAVDTTGAGDTFTGFLMGGLARGASMTEAMEEAALAAALAVTRAGAAPAIPTLEEVRDFRKTCVSTARNM